MMTKFTFATQPRYDRTHGNITYSADSQPSRFSFNIRIVALYIKTHTEFQFTVRFNFQRVHVNLSIYIYIVTIVAKILKRTESRSSQNQSLFLTHPVHALFLFFLFFASFHPRFSSSSFSSSLSFFSLLTFHLSFTGQREEGRQSQEVGLVKWDRDLENPEWPTLEVAIRSPRERRTISSLLSLLHWFGSSFLSLSLFRSFNFPSSSYYTTSSLIRSFFLTQSSVSFCAYYCAQCVDSSSLSLFLMCVMVPFFF